jgi:putative endonuclease
VHQHREGIGSVFTRKYRCHDLVYYEYFESISDAIEREKQIKKWHRAWKIRLIKSLNPKMDDLSDKLMENLY